MGVLNSTLIKMSNVFLEIHSADVINFLFLVFVYSIDSQTGRGEDVHADETGAATLASQSHQVVRLLVVYTKELGRGEIRWRVTRYVDLTFCLTWLFDASSA